MSTNDNPEVMTIGEAEAKVHETGQHRGTRTEFSDDGDNWSEAWSPTEGGASHPTHARTTVKRKLIDGDIVKTRTTIRWDEYVPSVDHENHLLWVNKPTTLFGAASKMAAYRGAFRDVIGNRYEPAELDQSTPARTSSEDWNALAEATATAAEVRMLHDRIRGLREMTDPLDILLKARLSKFETEEAGAPKPTPPKAAK